MTVICDGECSHGGYILYPQHKLKVPLVHGSIVVFDPQVSHCIEGHPSSAVDRYLASIFTKSRTLDKVRAQPPQSVPPESIPVLVSTQPPQSVPVPVSTSDEQQSAVEVEMACSLEEFGEGA